MLQNLVSRGSRRDPRSGKTDLAAPDLPDAFKNATPARAVIQVSKRRWLWKFYVARGEVHEVSADVEERPVNGHQLPEGCNVEYAEIAVDGFPPWTTFGF